VPAAKPLSGPQLAVLRWIGDGSPDGVMDGHTYKLTAIALQNRRLVLVSKRGGVWRAVVTEAGRHYLDTGSYPPADARRRTPAGTGASSDQNPARTVGSRPTPSPRPLPQPATTPPPPGPPPAAGPVQQLIDEVIAAGGVLAVKRTDRDRDYPQLVASANRSGMLPAGKRMTTESDRWPDLEIHLVDTIPGTDVVASPVPVPERVAKYHPAVAAVRDKTERHEVSRQVLPRALRILQALAAEAERRGHTVDAVTDIRNDYGGNRWTGPNNGHLTITANGHTQALRIFEPGLPGRAHWERTRYYGSKESYPQDGSGTLALHLCGYGSGGRTFRWADRKTRALDHRLPEVLREIEIRAAEAEHAKLEAIRKAEKRRREWEQAIERAKVDLTEAARAKRLNRQLDDWLRAKQMNEYLTAMRTSITALTSPEETQAAEEWFDWAEAYLAKFDPLRRRLKMPSPPKATPEELRPFLHGWNPYGPEGY
jgi:hypothetical protein